jgi:hypothetical protein
MGGMNAMRTADVTARVVAWHNRHPLARRIAPENVSGVGIVVLPFALRAAEGDDAPPADLTPIFGDEWMFRAAPQRLGRWARLHGVYPLPGFGHWPLRQIEADLDLSRRADAQGLEGRTARHLITAVVDVAGQRVRLLLAPGDDPFQARVFGQRIFSLPRLGALAAAGATLGLALGVTPWRQPVLQDTPVAAPAAAVHTVAAASAASAASAPTAVAAASAASAATDAHAMAEPVEVPLPTSVEAELQDRARGAPPLARIRPTLSEDERRAARVQAAALRPAPAASAVAAASTGPVYALVTPPVRSRDDATAQQVLLQGLKAQVPTPGPTRLDVMAAQGRWRVVWWPHPQQKEAQALLLEARARGLKVDLIAF